MAPAPYASPAPAPSERFITWPPPPYASPAPAPSGGFIWPPPPPPPPPKDPAEYLEEFIKRSTAAANLLTLACFVAFAFLIGFDVWRAFKKRATWLPGKAFALSGVTVQIIVWWTSLSNIENGYKKEIDDLIWSHYMVVSGRVAVCVFIGYLLPGMAAPSVRVFGALAITICAQIASELLVLYNPSNTESESTSIEIGYIERKCLDFEYYGNPDYVHVNQTCIKQNYIQDSSEEEIIWSKVADLILMMCVIVLGLILCCTVLASKTIHGLLRQRISAIAEESKFQLKSIFSITEQEGIQCSNEKTKLTWNDFADEVLKSWFVARVCRDDYVISRSVFSSAVWIIVTICVLVFYKSPVFDDPTMFPLLCFIIIGWIVISWRWLASQLYCLRSRSWRRCLCLEDFWTSRTVELIDMYDLKRERQRFQSSKSKMSRLSKLQSLPTKIFTKVGLHKLLYLVWTLQLCVLFFSKVCGLLSEVTIGNIVCFCRKYIMNKKSAEPHESYTRILECLCMPGEDPSALWEANKMSLTRAKHLMNKGCQEGSSCEEINSVFCHYSLQWVEEGTQLLNELKQKALPSVSKHFPSVEKHCLKMTVVSLMTILIGLRKAKSDQLTKVVRSCHEVWDLVSFADECDIDLQADNINLLDDLNRDKDQVLMAADGKFYKLQMDYDKLSSASEDCALDSEKVRAFLKDLSRKCENVLREENLLEDYVKSRRDLRDSRNWTKIAPSYTLFTLCKLMLDKDKDRPIEDFLEWIENSLRNVVASSMSKLPDMLVRQCWIWAQDFEEDKLWEAIQVAGKCKGMMEEWGQKSEKTLNTTQEKTLCQRFKMCILCQQVEEPPNGGEQALSNIDHSTIEVTESPSQEVSSGTR